MGIPGSASPLLLVQAAAAAPTGYEIERSLRFNSADSAYLGRTPSTAGNRTTWTWAGWVKKCGNGTYQGLFTSTRSGFESLLIFNNSDKIEFINWTGSYNARKITTAVFRDPSAWYHIVFVWDTTNATAADRCRLYVNGVRNTIFDTSTDPASSSQSTLNDAYAHQIANYADNPNYDLNGYLADVHFIDGQALDPTDFGEFDADTGIWNPIEFTGFNNPNDGTTWSSNSTGVANDGTSAPANAFDGNLSTQVYTSGGANSELYYDIPNLTVNSTVRVHIAQHSETNVSFYVIDTDDVKYEYLTAAPYAKKWVDITGVAGKTIKRIGAQRNSNGHGSAHYAWEIDGYVLLNGADDNSFHLPFSDNSSAAALGDDTSGNNNDWTVNNIVAEQALLLPAVAFDGSGDYLSISGTNSEFAFGTGDFTVEFFINTSNWDVVPYDSRPSAINGDYLTLYIDSNGALRWDEGGANRIQGSNGEITKNAWVHIAATREGTSAKLFVNGSQTGSTYTDNTNYLSATNRPFIGAQSRSEGGSAVNGFISNLRVIKGTALYTSNFTRPSTPLTNVTNTVLLCCQSSSSATAATVSPGAITANGDASATTKSDSTAANDSLVDVPTNGTETDSGAGGEVRGNYCTLNPLDTDGGIFANGNLELTTSSSGYSSTRSTIAVSSGKWYWEVTFSNNNVVIGIAPSSGARPLVPGNTSTSYAFDCWDGDKRNNDITSTYASALAVGDVLGVALDLDNGTLTFYKNGTSLGTAFSSISGTFSPCVADAISAASYIITCNFGQRSFSFQAPSGFKALCTANLPAPTVEDGSDYMDVLLYTGTGSSRSITGLDFSPDFIWQKPRSELASHRLADIVRGVDKVLKTNSTNAEATEDGVVDSFDSNGFTGGGTNAVTSGQTAVAWCWDAGSSTVSNTDGSITSSVRANPTAGFSIVTYTGNSTAGATIGHGLGVAPSMIIVKNRDDVADWIVYHSSNTSAPETDFLKLNATSATADLNTVWNDTAPTSTVFSVGIDGAVNQNTDSHVAYCFAAVEGYSAFGVADGGNPSFVYTGFRPRFLMLKRTNATSYWHMFDTARSTYNASTLQLYANEAFDEDDQPLDAIDFVSNGFVMRSTNSFSSAPWVYCAFAEHPFALNARAR